MNNWPLVGYHSKAKLNKVWKCQKSKVWKAFRTKCYKIITKNSFDENYWPVSQKRIFVNVQRLTNMNKCKKNHYNTSPRVLVLNQSKQHWKSVGQIEHKILISASSA